MTTFMPARSICWMGTAETLRAVWTNRPYRILETVAGFILGAAIAAPKSNEHRPPNQDSFDHIRVLLDHAKEYAGWTDLERRDPVPSSVPTRMPHLPLSVTSLTRLAAIGTALPITSVGMRSDVRLGASFPAATSASTGVKTARPLLSPPYWRPHGFDKRAASRLTLPPCSASHSRVRSARGWRRNDEINTGALHAGIQGKTFLGPILLTLGVSAVDSA